MMIMIFYYGCLIDGKKEPKKKKISNRKQYQSLIMIGSIKLRSCDWKKKNINLGTAHKKKKSFFQLDLTDEEP